MWVIHLQLSGSSHPPPCWDRGWQDGFSPLFLQFSPPAVCAGRQRDAWVGVFVCKTRGPGTTIAPGQGNAFQADI